MSNDLISRESVIDLIDKLGYINVGNHNDFKANCRMDKIRQEVSELPTSFDKEKVIEEFRKHSHNFYPSIDHYCLSQKAVNLKDATEIVEKGGIE